MFTSLEIACEFVAMLQYLWSPCLRCTRSAGFNNGAYQFIEDGEDPITEFYDPDGYYSYRRLGMMPRSAFGPVDLDPDGPLGQNTYEMEVYGTTAVAEYNKD